MTTPKLTTVNTVYRAWWEDHEGWDGAVTYADLDTAKAFATADYAREERVPEEEVPALHWVLAGAHWELHEGDDATPVYVYAERVLAPAGTPTNLDAVYRERAHLVAHLTALHPAVLVASAPDAPEWAIAYVDLPTGQASWHIAVRDLPLFADVAVVAADDPRAIWDRHASDEKYRRLDEATHLMREGRNETREWIAAAVEARGDELRESGGELSSREIRDAYHDAARMVRDHR
ncbi:hypothetical protein [Embleya sp. NPDC001921]